MSDKKLIAYKLRRPGAGGGWMFAGTTSGEAASALQNELEEDKGLSVEDCDPIVIEAYETTQAEIDALPEFQGW